MRTIPRLHGFVELKSQGSKAKAGAVAGKNDSGRSRRGAQAGVGGKNCRYGVDDHRGCGHIAVRTAWNCKSHMRLAFQHDRIGGMPGAHVHLEFHEDFFLAVGAAARDLMHAGDLARGDFQIFRLDSFFGNHRFDRFGISSSAKAEAVCHHGDGFRQAVMLDYSRCDLFAKFILRHSRADFFLQRQHGVWMHPRCARRSTSQCVVRPR